MTSLNFYAFLLLLLFPLSPVARNQSNFHHNIHNYHNHHGYHHLKSRLPIVFVYIMKGSCDFPDYIKSALQQSIFTQPDCNTVLLTNLKDCETSFASWNMTGLHLFDSVSITSNRTRSYENVSDSIFLDSSNSLWLTSALRFLLLEDLMIFKGWNEMLHVEADNMLYGRLTTVLPGLRKYYPLAITPLNVQLTFLTASVLWVSSVSYLQHFNSFLFSLSLNSNLTHDKYIDYLKIYSSKRDGAYADPVTGIGVKPFAINEMSMLAYYRELYPERLKLLPVLPIYSFPYYAEMGNITGFTSIGDQVGKHISVAIWDGGSYGQFIAGTKEKKGKNKRFTDGSHITGTAIRTTRCEVIFWCNNVTEFDYSLVKHHTVAVHHPSPRCYTAPYTRCGAATQWTPLWNLHVHSKSTMDFVSNSCDCQNEGGKNVSIYADNDRFYWKTDYSTVFGS
jgi:hypothetical protein